MKDEREGLAGMEARLRPGSFWMPLALLATVSGMILVTSFAAVIPDEVNPEAAVAKPGSAPQARSFSAASAAALQKDGKIILTDMGCFCLTRYNPDGSLDPSFGSGGKVMAQIAYGDTAFALALQEDGKILVAGRSYVTSNDFALARFNVDGSLDRDFGREGKVTTDFSSIPMFYSPLPTGRFRQEGKVTTEFIMPSYDEAFSLALQADGKIVLAGTGLVRYNADGSLDPSFGVEGKVTRPAHVAHAVVLQEEGKILAAGVADNQFTLVRYNADGSLDSTFGTTGIVTTHFHTGTTDHGVAYALAMQGDGKSVAAGITYSEHDVEFAVARYQRNGSLDRTFGHDGMVLTPSGLRSDLACGMAIQLDGKIVVVGSSLSHGRLAFTLIRYHPNGTLDHSFGTAGTVRTKVGPEDDYAAGLVLQPDGKIVVVGTSGGGRIHVLRYHSNGSVDRSFGDGGMVTTHVGVDEGTS